MHASFPRRELTHHALDGGAAAMLQVGIPAKTITFQQLQVVLQQQPLVLQIGIPKNTITLFHACVL